MSDIERGEHQEIKNPRTEAYRVLLVRTPEAFNKQTSYRYEVGNHPSSTVLLHVPFGKHDERLCQVLKIERRYFRSILGPLFIVTFRVAKNQKNSGRVFTENVPLDNVIGAYVEPKKQVEEFFRFNGGRRP